jgi:outer membrane protein, heavy metal efflux system
MTTGTDRVRYRGIRVFPVGIIALMMALTGCATSLDTAPDMQRASSLIAERSGESPQWDLSWDEPHAIWDGVSPLAESDAVRIALVNSRAIRAALEEIAIARADLVQSGLLPNPVLSVALGFPIDGSGGATNIGVGLTQQLVALWLRGDRMTAAEFDLDRAILSVSDHALELVKIVRQQHAEIAFASRERALLAEQQALLEELVSLMQQRQDAGEASRLDVSRLSVQKQMMRAALIEQDQQITQDKLELLSLMGWSEVSIEWEIDHTTKAQGFPSLGFPPGIPDERALTERLDTQRVDLLAARATAYLHAASLRLEDRQRLFRSVEAGVGFERDDDRRKELGPIVSLEIPIFDTNDAKVARAAAMYRQSIIEADRIRQQAITEVRSLHSECLRLADLIALHESEILPAVEENLRLVQQTLDAGIIDATVLIEAQRERIDAQLRLNDLHRRITRQKIALDRAVGGRID